MVRIDDWPHEIESMDKERTVFARTTATVARVFPAQGKRPLALKFREDTTQDGQYQGVTWAVQGAYDKVKNKRLPYEGPVPAEGQQVQVVLSLRRGDSRNFYDVRDLRVNGAAPQSASNGAAQPAGQPEAPQTLSERLSNPDGTPVRWGYVDHPKTLRKIEVAQTFNNLTALMAAITQAPKSQAVWSEDEVADLKAEWQAAYVRFKTGKPPKAEEPEDEPEGEPVPPQPQPEGDLPWEEEQE
jgi:hypothetical protein